MLSAVWRYRYFILASIRGELRGRFRAHASAALWFILHPLAQSLIFSIVLAEVMRSLANSAAYPIYLLPAGRPSGFLMKIGIDARNLVSTITGIARYVIEMTRALAALGHHPVLFLPEPPTNGLPELPGTDIRIAGFRGAGPQNDLGANGAAARGGRRSSRRVLGSGPPASFSAAAFHGAGSYHTRSCLGACTRNNAVANMGRRAGVCRSGSARSRCNSRRFQFDPRGAPTRYPRLTSL